jgi:hypothetical protein
MDVNVLLGCWFSNAVVVNFVIDGFRRHDLSIEVLPSIRVLTPIFVKIGIITEAFLSERSKELDSSSSSYSAAGVQIPQNATFLFLGGGCVVQFWVIQI